MSRLGVALLSIAFAGCFSEPGRPSGTGDDDGGLGSDAGHDGPAPDAFMGPLQVKVLSVSHWNDDGSVGDPASMDKTHWALNLTGAQNGQLLLLLGTVDNGGGIQFDQTHYPTGWTNIANIFTAGPDTQTTIFAWKIAHDEPATQVGPYGDVNSSGTATYVVLAIDGFDPANPIETQDTGGQGDHPGVNPVPIASPGVSVTTPGTLLISAMAADWDNGDREFTYNLPTGFVKLVEASDKGLEHLDYHWSTMVVSQQTVDAGLTGPVSGTLTANGDVAYGIYGLIAIKPMPMQ
ncbi:MAG TPA: hypothetical protein VGM90_37840 [Kofleriaceae bacterium]